MNRAVQIQQNIPKGKKVEALNPRTDVIETGTVTGTWSENRIARDPDQGFYIRFADNEIYKISHRFIYLD